MIPVVLQIVFKIPNHLATFVLSVRWHQVIAIDVRPIHVATQDIIWSSK
jgi:hypothetical protein